MGDQNNILHGDHFLNGLEIAAYLSSSQHIPGNKIFVVIPSKASIEPCVASSDVKRTGLDCG